MIDSSGKVLRCSYPSVFSKFGWILRNGNGVQINHAVEGVVVVLHFGPVDQRSQIVSKVQGTGGGLHSAEQVWLSHASSLEVCIDLDLIVNYHRRVVSPTGVITCSAMHLVVAGFRRKLWCGQVVVNPPAGISIKCLTSI